VITTVRIAVARLESTPFIPILARIEVAAANTEDKIAGITQFDITLVYNFSMWFILALAILLRLPFITQSLWLDEAIEALALKGHFGPLLSYALADFQPPLYHFLLRGWTNLFGYSEIALRTPSLLAGVILVYYAYQLTVLLSSRKAGFIAGALVATNPLLIYYSVEGRTYIMTTLFVTASFYYLTRLLKGGPGLRPALAYLISTALALWSSYLAAFVVLSQFLYLLFRKKFKLLSLPILVAVSFLPWIPSLLGSLRFGLRDATITPEWGRVVGGISPRALFLTWVKLVVGRISYYSRPLYAGVVGVVALLHFLALKHLNFRRYSVLLIWLLLPLALAALISFFVPVYSYTRVLFVMPAYLILLSLALARAPRLLTYLVLALQLVFITQFALSPRFHREDWRSLTEFLNGKNSGLVALPSLKSNTPFLYYQLSLPLVELPAVELELSPVYYVIYAEDIFDPQHLGRAKLTEAGYTINKEESFIGLPLIIYEK